MTPRRALGLIAAATLALLLYLFQPWALFTVTTVHDALPGATAPVTLRPAPTTTSSAPEISPPPSAPVALTTPGSFRSYEHQTSGTAQLLRLPDGSAVLRLTGLSTSNGPDVRVWLSSRTVDTAADADQGAWLELAGLKGNRGDQNYVLPAGADISKYASVVLWCRRFSVAFGAAPLRPV